jgi:hypothetical protein
MARYSLTPGQVGLAEPFGVSGGYSRRRQGLTNVQSGHESVDLPFRLPEPHGERWLAPRGHGNHRQISGNILKETFPTKKIMEVSKI